MSSYTPPKRWLVKEKQLRAVLDGNFVDAYNKVNLKAELTGDTFTGDIILNGGDLKLYSDQAVIGYSDAGTSKTYELNDDGLTIYD